MRCSLILAWVVLCTYQCASLRLMQITGSKDATKGRESMSLSSVEFGDCAMRKITAFGSNEQEFMENFDAQRSKMELSCSLEAQGDNSETNHHDLAFAKSLQTGQLLSNSSNALLEIGSSQ